MNFIFDKIFFTFFQLSRDRESCLTASVQDFTLCGILLERLFSCYSESITAAHVRDHSTAMICSVQKCNWRCCNVGYQVFRTDSIYSNDASAYNVRKLYFQANLCETFAEDKKHHCCGDLVLGWGV